jgi:hypothetical protein
MTRLTTLVNAVPNNEMNSSGESLVADLGVWLAQNEAEIKVALALRYSVIARKLAQLSAPEARPGSRVA